MTLRARILLGYGYLVALLLMATASALLGFLHLSAGIDAVLEKNFASVRASMEMIESLERQDSATLAALVEGRPARESLEEFDADFVDALTSAQSNLTEDEEPAILKDLRGDFDRYRVERDRLLSSRPEHPLAAYDSDVFPPFSRVKSDVVRLLEVNQQAMFRAGREARQSAVLNGTWLGFVVAIALVSLVVLSRALQRDFLSRLEELSGGMAAVASGETRRRLREEGHDELSTIARNVNALLDLHEAAAARHQGRLANERQLVLGLVAALGEGAALYSVSGRLVAGDEKAAARHHAIGEWIAETGRQRAEAAGGDGVSESVAVEEGEVELRLLRAGRRPVGWLACRHY